MSLPPILNRALKAAYIGANEIIHSSKRIQNIQITKKEGNDITTNIDLLVQEKVFDELQKHYPDFSYLGEESNEHISQEEENIWILDPIDGTKNFAKQYPHYALSLACLKNKEVICAVVIDPVRDEVFCAAEGTGALLNNRRIRHSNKKTLQNAFLSNVGHKEKDADYNYSILDTISELSAKSITFRRSGCTSLDLCYAAAGRIDGFWGYGLKVWDRAAGLYIAQSAGCLVSSFDGRPDAFDSDHVILSAPRCFKELSQAVRKGFQFIE